MRSVRYLVLGLAALVLSACASTSLVRLAYANAALAYANVGPVIAWMIDDYVDLSDGQEGFVRGRIARVMEWHRAEELPKYRLILESLLAQSRAPFKADELGAHQRALRTHYYRLSAEVMPDLAEFLGNLDAEQVAHLERKFAEENRKFVRESVSGSPEERVRKRMRRFTGHIESWVGKLEESQLAVVAGFYREQPDLADEMLAERRFRQSEVLVLVRTRPPREQMLAQLRHLFVDVDSWRRPEYVEKLRARERRSFEMLATLSATLTPEQRAALQSRIRGLMGDITTLIASS